MLKRDKTDELYNLAVERYKKECPGIPLCEPFLDSIWFSIYGKLNTDGEEAAEEYVKNGKLW